MVPLRDLCVGLFGVYCSWNCAKRGLLGLRTRPWYSLLAITAIKTGAKLPIVLSPTGKPPPAYSKQIVKKIPPSLNVKVVQHVCIPIITPDEKSYSDSEPDTFESVMALESITQASLEI